MPQKSQYPFRQKVLTSLNDAWTEIEEDDNTFRKQIKLLAEDIRAGKYTMEELRYADELLNSRDPVDYGITAIPLEIDGFDLIERMNKIGLSGSSSDKNGASEFLIAWMIRGGKVQVGGDDKFDVIAGDIKIEVKSSGVALYNDCATLEVQKRKCDGYRMSNLVTEMRNLSDLVTTLDGMRSTSPEDIGIFETVSKITEKNFDGQNFRLNHLDLVAELARRVGPKAGLVWNLIDEEVPEKYEPFRNSLKDGIKTCVNKNVAVLYDKMIREAVSNIPDVKGVQTFAHVIKNKNLPDEYSEGSHTAFVFPESKFTDFYEPRALNRGEIVIHPKPYRRAIEKPDGWKAEVYEAVKQSGPHNPVGVKFSGSKTVDKSGVEIGDIVEYRDIVVRILDKKKGEKGTAVIAKWISGKPEYDNVAADPDIIDADDFRLLNLTDGWSKRKDGWTDYIVKVANALERQGYFEFENSYDDVPHASGFEIEDRVAPLVNGEVERYGKTIARNPGLKLKSVSYTDIPLKEENRRVISFIDYFNEDGKFKHNRECDKDFYNDPETPIEKRREIYYKIFEKLGFEIEKDGRVFELKEI